MHPKLRQPCERKLTARQAHELLCRHGKKAFNVAQRILLEERIENQSVRDALHYFIRAIWRDYEYPGFMTLTCKAVDGDPAKTMQLGASLVLIRGAMDVHDEIIDEQTARGNKPTLLGKYGLELSILVGDILFYEGLATLSEATFLLRQEERQTIRNMVKNAMFEVGTGVASEIDFKGKFDLQKEDCMKIIVQKSACSEMHARIGAMIGGGTKAEIEALGSFARLFGVLTMIRDEFIDIYEPRELQNRIQNECLPVPLCFAFQDKNAKAKILRILAKKTLSEADSQRILNVISKSDGIRILKNHMEELKNTALSNLEIVRKSESTQLLSKLLDPIYEGI